MKTIKLVVAFVLVFITAGAYANIAQNFLQDAKKGNLQGVKSYMAKRLDVHVKDEYGMNALMWASVKGHTEIAEIMIRAKKTYINIKDKDGVTALIYASQNGHTEIVKALVKNKAWTDIQMYKGRNTALIQAVIRQKTEIVEILINAGANVSLKNAKGGRALDYAKRYPESKILVLVSAAVDARKAKTSSRGRAFNAINKPNGVNFRNLGAVRKSLR